jgi:hypothetical protein
VPHPRDHGGVVAGLEAEYVRADQTWGDRTGGEAYGVRHDLADQELDGLRRGVEQRDVVVPVADLQSVERLVAQLFQRRRRGSRRGRLESVGPYCVLPSSDVLVLRHTTSPMVAAAVMSSSCDSRAASARLRESSDADAVAAARATE